MGIILETPSGSVIHPGDWTIERHPVSGKTIDYGHLATAKRPTILMLESLGATNSEEPVTEETMLNNLFMLITNAPGRIIIATFSSQIQRIRQIDFLPITLTILFAGKTAGSQPKKKAEKSKKPENTSKNVMSKQGKKEYH